jgi:hypothetical protein
MSFYTLIEKKRFTLNLPIQIPSSYENSYSNTERKMACNNIPCYHIQWILVNWYTLEPEYSAQIYEAACKGLKSYMYIRQNISFTFTE